MQKVCCMLRFLWSQAAYGQYYQYNCSIHHFHCAIPLMAALLRAIKQVEAVFVRTLLAL
jgi:hypothetical protein